MFYGREEHLHQLNGLWRKKTSSLVTCRGRRRIGKSTLIEYFAEKSKCRFIKIEGTPPHATGSNQDELQTFAIQLAAQCQCESTPPATWLDAFIRLAHEISPNEKTLVLLDEISWLGYYDSSFSDTLKIAWDNYLKKKSRLILVLCGSVSSWIKDSIINNSAFMGRRSLDIIVKELSLRECMRFWGRNTDRIATKDILDVLSVTGGVPRYLEEIDPGLSAEENLRNFCFRPNAILRTDFDEMFSDVITKQATFTSQVLRCLLDGPCSVSGIAKSLGTVKNGRISDALERLVESGFATPDAGKNPETGQDIRERKYRLRDNYSRFYLKYLEPIKAIIDDNTFAFSSLDQLPNWNTIRGLQFENLILNNYRDLLPLLHLEKTMILSAAPYRKNASNQNNQQGYQIDLLIQTPLSNILVEIKRQAHIGHNIIREMETKCRRFMRSSSLSLRTVLVYDGELEPSVEADGFFDAIISARDLLFL